MRGYDARTFGGGKVVRLILRGEHDGVLIDIGKFAENGGELLHSLLPGRAINHNRRRRLGNRDLRSFLTEVGRAVLFLGAHLSFGLHAEVVVESCTIASVGGQPQRAGQGLAIIIQRQLQAVHGCSAMGSVGVVQLGIAESHLHIGHANVVDGTVDHRAVLGANRDLAGIADRIAQKVGRQLLVGLRLSGRLSAKRGEGAMQFGGHGIEQHRSFRGIALKMRGRLLCASRDGQQEGHGGKSRRENEAGAIWGHDGLGHRLDRLK